MEDNKVQAVHETLGSGLYSGLYTGQTASINWQALLGALVDDCNYTGSLMYEVSSYAVDAIVSLNSVAHNYYGTLCPEYTR